MLSPCFCLASCLANGDTADELNESICGLLDRNLQVEDPAKLAFGRSPEDEQKFQAELTFQAELMEQCYVKDNGPGRDGSRPVEVNKRRNEAT